MTRDEALELLDTHIHTDSLKKHCLATEAVMRELARRLSQDEELWGIAGLLHDLDFETTKEDPKRHGLETATLLASRGLSRDALNAILRHNAEALELRRETPFDFSLTCAETITGLIVAAALVHPDKRIGSLKAQSVVKRMKSKDFAKNVNRDHVRLCEQLGIPLIEFIELSLKGMNAISGELGL